MGDKDTSFETIKEEYYKTMEELGLSSDQINKFWTTAEMGKIMDQMPYPLVYYSPAAIFANRVPALDVNFIDPARNFKKQYSFLMDLAKKFSSDQEEDFVKYVKDYYGLTELQAEESFILVNQIRDLGDNPTRQQKDAYLGSYIINSDGKKESNGAANTAVILSPVISKWYIALRNISILGLLIVLLYIGIRILISSASEELAKYKIMLKDWAMALFLVFFIHYLMLGILTVTDGLIDAIDESVFTSKSATTGGNATSNFIDQGSTQDYLFANVRVLESISRYTESERDTGWLDVFGYALMYAMLVWYTIIFTIKYLKRAVYMAFLTVIAPMVALTYPIDKIKDKRAQAFDHWFREYTFNLLLQPIHLLLYIILVCSAMEFATSNPIYAIVALAFLLEAEKYIKNMFGVRGEGGGLSQAAAGFTSGALFASGMRMLDRVASGENKMLTGAANDKVSAENGNEDDGNIRQQEIKDDDAVASIASFDSGGTAIEGPGGNIGDGENPLLLDGDDNNINIDGGGSPTGLFGDVVYGPDQLDGFDTYEFGSNGPADMTALGTQNSDFDELGAGTRPLIDDPTQENNPGFFGRTIRGISRATRGRFINKNNTVRLAKFATRASLGLAGAATLGTIGLAAGLASGEGLTGALKYAGLGAASGGALGLATANLGMRAITGAKTIGKRFTGDFRRGYYSPKEFREKENARIAREFLRDRESINFFKDNYGDNYREKMQQALQLKRYGINDLNQLNKAIDIQDKYGLTAQQTATVAKLGNSISRQDLIDPEKRAKIMHMISKQLPNRMDQLTVMSYLDQYHSIGKETGLSTRALNDAAENIRTVDPGNNNIQDQIERISENSSVQSNSSDVNLESKPTNSGTPQRRLSISDSMIATVAQSNTANQNNIIGDKEDNIKVITKDIGEPSTNNDTLGEDNNRTIIIDNTDSSTHTENVEEIIRKANSSRDPNVGIEKLNQEAKNKGTEAEILRKEAERLKAQAYNTRNKAITADNSSDRSKFNAEADRLQRESEKAARKATDRLNDQKRMEEETRKRVQELQRKEEQRIKDKKKEEEERERKAKNEAERKEKEERAKQRKLEQKERNRRNIDETREVGSIKLDRDGRPIRKNVIGNHRPTNIDDTDGDSDEDNNGSIRTSR